MTNIQDTPVGNTTVGALLSFIELVDKCPEAAFEDLQKEARRLLNRAKGHGVGALLAHPRVSRYSADQIELAMRGIPTNVCAKVLTQHQTRSEDWGSLTKVGMAKRAAAGSAGSGLLEAFAKVRYGHMSAVGMPEGQRWRIGLGLVGQ